MESCMLAMLSSWQSFLCQCFCLVVRIPVMLDVLFFGLLAKQRSWPCLVIKNPQALFASRMTTLVPWPKSKKGYKFHLVYLKSLSISVRYFIPCFSASEWDWGLLLQNGYTRNVSLWLQHLLAFWIYNTVWLEGIAAVID